jgi:hypothetical protein
LQKYSSQYTQEVSWIDESYSQLKTLAPLEGLAREQIEPTTVSSGTPLWFVDGIECDINIKGRSRLCSAYQEAYDLKCNNLLQALYKKVNEHMPQLEKVNVVGSRYIREAKVRPRALTLSDCGSSECVFDILSHLEIDVSYLCKYIFLLLSLSLIHLLKPKINT